MREQAVTGRGAIAQASSPLFGRASELHQVVSSVEDPTARLITITGRGGVGKTRLALAALDELRQPFGGRVTFISLAGVDDVALVVPEIATALGIPPTAEAAASAITARLGDDEHVLVLDNLEHVLDVAGDLDDILDRCPGVTILATSQAALRLRRERLVELVPLPVPAPGGDVPVEQPAVALYCDAAAVAVPGFAPTTDDRREIAELCRQLEGLPLAIELGAARAGTLPAAELLRLGGDGGLDLIARERPDAPRRHHALRAAIAWTFDLLEPDEQQLLCGLAVVAGTFDTAFVLALASDRSPSVALDQLAALVDLHLVEPLRSSDPARYRIPESIRTFARDQVDDQAELGALRRRHVSVRAAQARAASEAVEAGTDRLLPAIEADRDDLHAALHHALEDELASDALDLARGLAAHWEARGYHAVHEALLERVLVLGDRASIDPVELAPVLAASALLGLRRAATVPTPDLLARLERAEAIARAAGDGPALINVLTAWMRLTPVTGDIDRARRAATESIGLASEPGHERFLSAIRVWVGMLANVDGDEDRAIELGLLALSDGVARDDPATIVRAHLLLEHIAEARPRDVPGLLPAVEVLALARRTGRPAYESLLLGRVMTEAAAADDGPAAIRWAEEALTSARTVANTPVILGHLIALAKVAAANGDWTPAARFVAATDTLIPLVGNYVTPAVREKRDAMLASARTQLGPATFDDAVAEGRGWTVAEATEAALGYVRLRAAHGSATGSAGSAEIRSADGSALPHLTARQRQVLVLVAAGLSNKDIGIALGITPKTVMHHTTSIYRSLGVTGRGEATAWAFRAGLAG